MTTVSDDLPLQGPVQVQQEAGGSLWRVRLATPKANILDQEKFELLGGIFRRAAGARELKAIILEADGPHFSFGASVEEHLPGSFDTMIRTFHDVVRGALASEVVCLAAVRGQCLGGALELISVCSRIFVAADAMLGQPEIRLGVFPPVASVLLPERIGRARSEDICLSGRILPADEALRIGLVDELTDDPEAAALDYFRRYLEPRSAASLRLAVRAVRVGLSGRLEKELQSAETLYLEELMATEDAVEGLEAFLAKRPPTWRNR